MRVLVVQGVCVERLRKHLGLPVAAYCRARLSPCCLLLVCLRRDCLLQVHPRRGLMHCQVGLGRQQDDWQPHVRSDAGLSALLQRCTACPRYLPATPSEPGCFGPLCSLMLGAASAPAASPPPSVSQGVLAVHFGAGMYRLPLLPQCASRPREVWGDVQSDTTGHWSRTLLLTVLVNALQVPGVLVMCVRLGHAARPACHCLTHHSLHCRCPGMFSGQGCGAELRYWPVADGGFYRCPRKGCGHQEWALQREGSPQVALEGVDGATFKVRVLACGPSLPHVLQHSCSGAVPCPDRPRDSCHGAVARRRMAIVQHIWGHRCTKCSCLCLGVAAALHWLSFHHNSGKLPDCLSA